MKKNRPIVAAAVVAIAALGAIALTGCSSGSAAPPSWKTVLAKDVTASYGSTAQIQWSDAAKNAKLGSGAVDPVYCWGLRGSGKTESWAHCEETGVLGQHITRLLSLSGTNWQNGLASSAAALKDGITASDLSSSASTVKTASEQQAPFPGFTAPPEFCAANSLIFPDLTAGGTPLAAKTKTGQATGEPAIELGAFNSSPRGSTVALWTCDSSEYGTEPADVSLYEQLVAQKVNLGSINDSADAFCADAGAPETWTDAVIPGAKPTKIGTACVTVATKPGNKSGAQITVTLPAMKVTGPLVYSYAGKAAQDATLTYKAAEAIASTHLHIDTAAVWNNPSASSVVPIICNGWTASTKTWGECDEQPAINASSEASPIDPNSDSIAGVAFDGNSDFCTNNVVNQTEPDGVSTDSSGQTVIWSCGVDSSYENDPSNITTDLQTALQTGQLTITAESNYLGAFCSDAGAPFTWSTGTQPQSIGTACGYQTSSGATVVPSYLHDSKLEPDPGTQPDTQPGDNEEGEL
jgi:hypothetical protein